MTSKERATYIFGSICLAAILLVLFTKEQLSNDQRAIMRFLIALCAALLSYFFLGKFAIILRRKGQIISAGGSFAVFVLLSALVDPMNTKSAIATVAPALVPKSQTITQAQEVLREAGQYEGKADGVQDSQLSNAISKWQKATNRNPNGVIEASDLPALRDYLRSQTSNPKAISQPVIYRHHRVLLNYDGPAGQRHGLRPPYWRPFTALQTETGESLDADNVSVVTVPADHIGKETIELGDYAFLYNRKNGKTAWAQVGDIGPKQKNQNAQLFFEVSPHLAQQLGIPGDHRSVSANPGQVICLVFPGSGQRRVASAEQVSERTNRLVNAWGGLPRLQAELDHN